MPHFKKYALHSIKLSILLLAACQQESNYAPVKVVNQAFPPEENNTSQTPLFENNKKKAKREVNAKPYSGDAAPIVPPRKAVSSKTLFDKNSNKYRIAREQASETPGAFPIEAKKTEQNQLDNKNSQQKQSNLEPNASGKSQKNKAGINANKMASQSFNIEKNTSTEAKNPKNNGEKRSIISNNNKKVLKLDFEWPIKGKVIKNFVQSEKKGIDIAGSTGQTVHAAEAGKAVYCGQGLAGYGQLIIIKHNPIYLSAYAHNSKINISEGQFVEKGQPIGAVGGTGFKKAVLHFEIRKHGISINPLALLPK